MICHSYVVSEGAHPATSRAASSGTIFTATKTTDSELEERKARALRPKTCKIIKGKTSKVQ